MGQDLAVGSLLFLLKDVCLFSAGICIDRLWVPYTSFPSKLSLRKHPFLFQFLRHMALIYILPDEITEVLSFSPRVGTFCNQLCIRVLTNIGTYSVYKNIPLVCGILLRRTGFIGPNLYPNFERSVALFGHATRTENFLQIGHHGLCGDHGQIDHHLNVKRTCKRYKTIYF
jgi:hypothetical protein